MAKKPKFDPNQPFESAETVGTKEDAVTTTEKPKKPKFDPNKPFDTVEETVKKKDTTPVSPEPGSKKSETPSEPQSTPSKKSTTGPTIKREPKGFFGTIKSAWDELVEAYNTPDTEATPKKIDPIVNAVKRGLNLGNAAEIVSPFSKAKPDDVKIKELARIQKENTELPASDAYNKFNESKTVKESLTALVENPVQIIGELTAESLSGLANYGATRVGAGMLMGGAIGSVFPVVGTAGGAGSGAIAGLADTSLALEYTGSFIESLQNAGVDVTDEKQLKEAFEDDELLESARSHALKKGIPIAIFDLISGGVAGKIVAKPAKSLVTKIARGGAEFGVQATLGGAGEAAGQTVSGEDLNPSAIIAEMIGELGTTPIEVSSNLLGRAKQAINPDAVEATIAPTVDEAIAKAKESVDVNDIKSIDANAEAIQNKIDEKETKQTTDISGKTTVQEGTGSGEGGGVSADATEKTLQAQEKEKLAVGNKITWDVYGNEDASEWTVIKQTQPKRGQKAITVQQTIAPNKTIEYTVPENELLNKQKFYSQSEPVEEVTTPEVKEQVVEEVKTPEVVEQKVEEIKTPGENVKTKIRVLTENGGKQLASIKEQLEAKAITKEEASAQVEELSKSGDVLKIENTPVGKHEETVINSTNDSQSFHEALKKSVGERTEDALQVEVKDAEVYDEIVKAGGKLYLSEDNNFGAFVDSTGYMGSLFKNPKSKVKGVAKTLQDIRIKDGGRWFDAFGTHLEDIYIKNGFRPIARMKFNEEYAPEGWKNTNLKNKPDLVFFAYDPEGKYSKGEGEYFDDWDKAVNFTKEFIDGNEENIQAILQGGTDKTQKAEPVSQDVPHSQSGGEKEVETPEGKKRKFAKQVVKDKTLSETVRTGLSENAKTYIPKEVRITDSEAKAIIDAKGPEQAMSDYMDRTNGMSPDVRVVLGENLIRKFNELEDYDSAIKVADNLSEYFTDLGRAVNAGKVFNLLTPQGVLRYVTREISKSKDKFSKRTSTERTRSKKEVDAINKKAVEEVLNNPKVKKRIASEVKKGKIKQAIDFLESLKIDTKGKALDVTFGITAAAWNSLITVVQKGLEAGLTISQAINKGIAKVKEKEFDEPGARVFLDEQLKDYRVTLDPALAIKEELKSQGTKIEDVIRQHYTVVSETKKSLVDKLVADAKVSPEDAQSIANDLSKEFDALTKAAKEKALKKYLPREGTTRQKKELVDQIIEASNLGALSEDQYRDAISEKLGPKAMTAEQAKKVTELADAVQKAKEGFDKARATEKLLTYINKNIEGISWKDIGMSIWYANILSGISTQILNLTANFFEIASEAFVTTVTNPKESGWILKGLFNGWGRGMLEAMDTIQHGHQPTKFEQKIQASATLEQVKFKGGPWNPYNYLKYVSRLMNAADIFYYHGLREMRAREIAVKEAKLKKKDQPNVSTIKEATQSIYQGVNPWQEALDVAKAEGWTGRDLNRRAYEILEQKRSEFIIRDSNDEGARGTFNYEPEGFIGALTGGINRFIEVADINGVKPLKFIIPFTRIISNVTNRYLDWSPVGLWRAASGDIGFKSKLTDNYYRKYTPEERVKVLVKAMTGMAGFVAMYALTDEDDGEFKITADGTGDVQKNFELMETGWRPYSIRVGNTWYEYKNTPLAIPFAILGYMRDAQKYKGEKDLEAKISIILFGTMKYLMDLSFLQSLSSFFDTFSKQNPGGADNFFRKTSKTVESTAKSFVIPNAFTQVSRSMQEVMDMPIKKANGFGDQLIRDVPLLRDHLGNIYDALGDPVVPNQVERFMPLKPSRTNEDTQKLWALISENNAWVGRPRRTTQKPNGDTLTDDEYDKYSLLAGQITKQKLSQNYSRLVVMTDKEEIRDEISKLKTEARKEARDRLFGLSFF